MRARLTVTSCCRRRGDEAYLRRELFFFLSLGLRRQIIRTGNATLFTHYILGIAFILLYTTEDVGARRRQTFCLGRGIYGWPRWLHGDASQSWFTQAIKDIAYHFRNRLYACALDESGIGNITVVQCGPETRWFLLWIRRLCFSGRRWGLALGGHDGALLALLALLALVAAVLASDSAFRRPPETTKGEEHWPTPRDGDWSGVFGDTIEAARWCSMASNVDAGSR